MIVWMRIHDLSERNLPKKWRVDMKLCVLGWYGSETLGDRAILDGIIYIYSQLFDSLEVDIGSLFPVLTERTIFEDEPFMSRHTNLKVGLFDSRDKKT